MKINKRISKKPETWAVPPSATILLNGVEYDYNSGVYRFDNLVSLTSLERGVKNGDTRVINGKLFYAEYVKVFSAPFFWPTKSRVYWTQYHETRS